jgi:hypothetical protein
MGCGFGVVVAAVGWWCLVDGHGGRTVDWPGLLVDRNASSLGVLRAVCDVR